MQVQIKKVAGICVLVAAAMFVAAQGPSPKRQADKPVKHVLVHKARKHSRRRSRRRVVHHRRHIVHKTKHVAAVMVTGAETSLVGIHLFDAGVKVLGMYGNPDFIQNLGDTVSSAPSGGGAGGFGGRPGGFGQGGAPQSGNGGLPGLGAGPGGAGPRRGHGGAAGAASFGAGAKFDEPGIPGDSITDQQAGLSGRPGAAGGGARAGQGGGPAFGGRAGGGGFPPGGAGAAGGGAGANNNANATESAATYVQWVYKHGPSQLKFIIDEHDRVVQIEAVGLDDPSVHTKRGISYGATFKSLVKKYGPPDAYDINGDNLVLRYLDKYHVVFRLNRLENNKPHEVTAIVVTGGKG